MRLFFLPLALAVAAGCSTVVDAPTEVGDGDGDVSGDGDGDGDGDIAGDGDGDIVPLGGAPGSGGEMASGGSSAGGDSSESGGSDSGGSTSGGSSSGGSSGGSPAGGSGGSDPEPDTDGDGVPDSEDQCPGGDDLQDLNENDEIDECEPGWCHKDSDPEKSLCSVGFGFRQGYCTMEQDGNVDPGECIQCPTYTYDCDDDWSNGCEKFSTGAHPCVP